MGGWIKGQAEGKWGYTHAFGDDGSNGTRIPMGQRFQWDDGSKLQLINNHMYAAAICARNEKIQQEMQLFNNQMTAQFAQGKPVLHETVLHFSNEISPAWPAQLDD